MEPTLHPNAQKVATALQNLGVAGQVRELDDAARTAQEAAALLGIDVGAVCNSLIFNSDGEPLLVLVSATSVQRATPDFVRDATGQPIGGVSPVGHPAPIRTIIDSMLGNFETVWAAGGHPHYVFPTTYDELVRITGGQPAQVAP